MALKYPDRLESNNPAAYGIVKATEISGHRTVQSVDDLYTLADAILSDSGNNTNNDAIGQKWYVISETKEYELIDWNNRKSSAGWEKVDSNYLPLTGGTMTGDIVFSSPTDYEYVDLGLPSGLLWAKYNVGATSEEEAGLYFQWGDTQGYTAEQVGDGEGLKPFDWGDYKFSIDGTPSNFSKYNASDRKTVLDPEDDAAHVNMGGNWRMPTENEYKELCLNTDIYLVPSEGEEIQGTAQEQSGSVIINWVTFAEGTLKGIKFYKKGDKQTYMFVPASGVADAGSVQGVGEYGSLWASSLTSSGVQRAWFVGFGADFGGVGIDFRFGVVPVRGVWNGDVKIKPSGIIIENKTDQDLLNAAGGTTPISDILSSTEGSLSDLEARVKANEDKLVIVQGEETVDGSIKKALKDAKDYTDQKLAWTILD